VLEQREIKRVGGDRTIKVDVRVLAATNRDLREEVNKGNFREDLYFRLSVVHVELPPMRERREDIPSLANHFLRDIAEPSRHADVVRARRDGGDDLAHAGPATFARCATSSSAPPRCPTVR
jgi:transcriptional regulator with GAF, ATPase, and Fis domain